MVAGFLLIVVGLIAVGWGRFVVRYLQEIRAHATARGAQRYDRFMNRTHITIVFKASQIVGIVAIVVGIVYCLSEL